MPAPRVSFDHNPFSTPVRLLARALAYLVIKPVFWLVYRADYGDRLWEKIVERMRRSVIEGPDFGDYQLTEHDVVVATYAKCGTNWTMQIAHQIATLGEGEFTHIHDVIPWPDYVKQDQVLPLDDGTPLAESPTGLRIIKTHLESDRVPYSEEARYICVLRDPKDAFVSNYHFLRQVIFGDVMPPVGIWLRRFCSRDFLFVWSTHLHSYWKDRARPNLLILRFEEMKADLAGSVQRIADFMGVKLDAEQFARVCEKSSFRYMKGIEGRFDAGALTPLASHKGQMIRRGASGGSSELLSSEQQTTIDDFFRDDLKALGSDFPYTETYCDPELHH